MTPLCKQSKNYWAVVSFTAFSPWKYLCKSHQSWAAAGTVPSKQGTGLTQLHGWPGTAPLPCRACRPATELHELWWLSNFQYFSGWQQQWCSVCQLLARQSRFSVPHLVVELCVQSAHSHSQHSGWDLVGPWQCWYQGGQYKECCGKPSSGEQLCTCEEQQWWQKYNPKMWPASSAKKEF